MARTAMWRWIGATAIGCALVLGVSQTARAEVRTYEGDVIAVDLAGRSFTLRGTSKGDVLERKFRIGSPSDVVIDGDTAVLAEFAKGDHLVVSYESAGAPSTSHRTTQSASSPGKPGGKAVHSRKAS